MRISLMPSLVIRPAAYVEWINCPLCDGLAEDRVGLKRNAYRFGLSIIPLPQGGVTLRECADCGLLFKSAVPDTDSLASLLAAEAVNEWRAKEGEHPSLPRLRPIIESGRLSSILDVGASNGDLLKGLSPYCDRLSAFDAVSYPNCEAVVTGEYILGSFEQRPNWSGEAYDLVTAFDVFEHFLDPKQAIRNILEFVQASGVLVVETGNWHAARPSLGAWYYCNLVEHQIFWSARTFEFICDEFGLDLLSCDVVNHKYRIDMTFPKRTAISAFKYVTKLEYLQRSATKIFGVDSKLLSPPGLLDHLFVVARKK